MNNNEKLDNCWEFWDCPKDKMANCPAHKTDSGRDCHNLTKRFSPRVERDFKNCWECPWCKYIKGLKE